MTWDGVISSDAHEGWGLVKQLVDLQSRLTTAPEMVRSVVFALHNEVDAWEADIHQTCLLIDEVVPPCADTVEGNVALKRMLLFR